MTPTAPVIAPSCGYFADQAPVLGYRHDESGYDPASLVDAVRAAYDGPASDTPSVEERRRQRAAIAAAHDRVYAAALGHPTEDGA